MGLRLPNEISVALISSGWLIKHSIIPESQTDKVKNPGPEDQALVCPWKGLLTIAGVETQNSETRNQESE